MDMALALAVGAIMGWSAIAILILNDLHGLGRSVMIGLLGGGAGMQLAKMASVAPVGDGHIYVFGLVVAAAVAGACLVIAGMMARRSGA
jgi:hypothetical protein